MPGRSPSGCSREGPGARLDRHRRRYQRPKGLRRRSVRPTTLRRISRGEVAQTGSLGALEGAAHPGEPRMAPGAAPGRPRSSGGHREPRSRSLSNCPGRREGAGSGPVFTIAPSLRLGAGSRPSGPITGQVDGIGRKPDAPAPVGPQPLERVRGVCAQAIKRPPGTPPKSLSLAAMQRGTSYGIWAIASVVRFQFGYIRRAPLDPRPVCSLEGARGASPLGVDRRQRAVDTTGPMSSEADDRGSTGTRRLEPRLAKRHADAKSQRIDSARSIMTTRAIKAMRNRRSRPSSRPSCRPAS